MNAMKYFYGDEPLEKQKDRFYRQLDFVQARIDSMDIRLDNLQSDMANAIEEGGASKEAVESWKQGLDVLQSKFVREFYMGYMHIKSWLKTWGFLPEVDRDARKALGDPVCIMLIDETKKQYEVLLIDPKVAINALKLLGDEAVDKILKERKEK